MELKSGLRILAAVCIIATTFATSQVAPVEAASSKGIVTHRISGCDYYIVAIKTPSNVDYSVLEWFGGHDPDEDDIMVGNMTTYGMHTILDDTADESTDVWVEDYALSKSGAAQMLLDKCK
ncbi:hypothetical protein [Granulicella sp. L46]|uniref:hypothetical protein n=1 Tax=Granulicella sp. L46 TaxID=1641865 RepID=UPI00131B5FAB|nr:hypothetical protein [Granulicella sp. L46]